MENRLNKKNIFFDLQKKIVNYYDVKGNIMYPIHLLLAEDDEMQVIIIKEYLTSSFSSKEYTLDVACNGQEAIEMYKKNKYPIILTDLHMPVLSGYEMIREIKSLDKNSIILVMTSDTELNSVISVMREGVQDYLIKPIYREQLIFKLSNIFDLYKLQMHKNMIENERLLRLEKQFSFSRIHSQNEVKNSNNYYRDLFYNIKTYFNQGNSFGAMLSVMQMLVNKAKLIDGEYRINPRVFDLVKNTLEICTDVMDIFEEIYSILHNQIEFTDVSVVQLRSYISEIIYTQMQDIIKVGNHTILIDENIVNKIGFIKIHYYYFEKMLKEVLINAMKFSKSNSEILVLIFAENNWLRISILNEINPQTGTNGIPVEYENLVFEPFIRLNKFVYESYKTPDFGLGLLLVQKIIEKHNGKVSIFNIRYTNTEKVCLEIRLPIV